MFSTQTTCSEEPNNSMDSETMIECLKKTDWRKARLWRIVLPKEKVIEFSINTKAKWKWECESTSLVVSNSLQAQKLYSPWNSPGQNTGVGIAFPFSRGSSQPRGQTQISRIAGRFFTSWAIRDSLQIGKWSRKTKAEHFKGILHVNCRRDNERLNKGYY